MHKVKTSSCCFYPKHSGQRWAATVGGSGPTVGSKLGFSVLFRDVSFLYVSPEAQNGQTKLWLSLLCSFNAVESHDANMNVGLTTCHLLFEPSKDNQLPWCVKPKLRITLVSTTLRPYLRLCAVIAVALCAGGRRAPDRHGEVCSDSVSASFDFGTRQHMLCTQWTEHHVVELHCKQPSDGLKGSKPKNDQRSFNLQQHRHQMKQPL